MGTKVEIWVMGSFVPQMGSIVFQFWGEDIVGPIEQILELTMKKDENLGRHLARRVV